MNAKRYVGLFLAVLALVGLMSVIGCETKYTQEEVDTFVQAKEQTTMQAAKTSYDVDLQTYKAETETRIKTDYIEKETYNKVIDEKDGLNTNIELLVFEKEGLQAQIDTYETEIQTVVNEVELMESSYVYDELFLGDVFGLTVSDRKLITLFDGEVDFDGKDYDAEEVITFTGLEIAINKNDFKDGVYLIVPEDGVEYAFNLALDLDVSKITDDEPLKFSFLGESVKITDWTGTDVTFTKGARYVIVEGESEVIDGKTVSVDIVGKDFVYIAVDGVYEKILEDDSDTIGGLDIKVESAMENDDGADLAILMIGKDVEELVSDGDEYEDDSIWNWNIGLNTIGLTLNTEFEEVDEDEDYQALGAGNIISLPNDYVTLTFDGVVDEDMEEYSFETDTKNGKPYVKAKGEFIKGIEDYSILYINATGFYDKNLDLVSADKVNLDDTDLELVLNGTNLEIGTVIFNLAVDTLEVDGTNISTEDDNYRAIYGTIVFSPENNLEDNEVNINIPTEKLTAGISLF